MGYLRGSVGTRVILLRHGQSTFNALGLYQGDSDDSVLTAVGFKQARRTGAYLRGTRIDAVYASPLQRARETACQVLAVVAPEGDRDEVQIQPLLRETRLPQWQGRAIAEVQADPAANYRLWKQRPQDWQTVEGFYPVLDAYDRANRFWQRILPQHPNETVLVVAHGGTNRALMGTALGIPPCRYHAMQQSNCGINILQFSTGLLEGGSMTCLQAMNAATHTGALLPPPKEGGGGVRLLLVPVDGNQVRWRRKLARFLRDVPIHFSLSDCWDISQATAAEILQGHAETVTLQVVQSDFLEMWQRTLLLSNASRHIPQLTTGLAIARPTQIQRLIRWVLGMADRTGDRLEVMPGTLSVLHYPATDQRPILQAVNLLAPLAAQPMASPLVAA